MDDMRFKTLFQYRKNMMAAAIVMILLYHTKGAWPEIALKKAAAYFYGGVDIFFFASGIGCFFSYAGRRDPAAFLGRRCERILPVYVPFMLAWITVEALGDGIGIPAALANLFGVHGFMSVKPAFNWYVSGMWLTYLLTPWFVPLAEKADTRLKALAGILALLVFSVAFWGDTELIIIVTRLPIFLSARRCCGKTPNSSRIRSGIGDWPGIPCCSPRRGSALRSPPCPTGCPMCRRGVPSTG